MKYTDVQSWAQDDGSKKDGVKLEASVEDFRRKFMMQLANWFWQLLASRPVNSAVAPVGQPLFTHIEATVQTIIEIFHAFTTTVDVGSSGSAEGSVCFAAQIYAQFLMAENQQVSFAAKQALVRVLRPKIRRRRQQLQSTTLTRNESVGSSKCTNQEQSTSRHLPPTPRAAPAAVPEPDLGQHAGAGGAVQPGRGVLFGRQQPNVHEHPAAALGLGPGGIGLGGIAGNLAALLPDLAGGGGNIPPPVLDMPEVDDEAMVELAIALSLQEQNPDGDGGAGAEIAQLQQGLQGLHQGLQQLANLGGPGFEGYPGLQGLAGILGDVGGGMGLPPDVSEDDEVIFNQHHVVDDDVPMDVVPVGAPVDAGVSGAPDEGDENGEQGDASNNEQRSHYSDTTASAPSDDDDDDEVMEAEPQRDMGEPSPAPAQREESGREADSDNATVGRTSPGKSNKITIDAITIGTGTDRQKQNIDGSDIEERDCEMVNSKLHALRLILLDELLKYMPRLRDLGGVRCIPYMQVLLMLTTEVTEKDRPSLDRLLSALVHELNVFADGEGDDTATRHTREVVEAKIEKDVNTTTTLALGMHGTSMSARSNIREMQLVILRLFSVLMSRSKSWQNVLKQGHPSSCQQQVTAPAATSSVQVDGGSNFVSYNTADALIKAGATQFSMSMLKGLLEFWKVASNVEDDFGVGVVQVAGATSGGGVKVGGCSVLKVRPPHPPPDMSPFFLKQYVKSHAHDVFEGYPQLLTEMALRLPYQAKKISEANPSIVESTHFDLEWYTVLCEYMMIHQTPYVRRQARKLLLYICGTKEKYRELRDLHTLASHMADVKKIVNFENQTGVDFYVSQSQSINLAYDILLRLIEHLNACVDIATSRTVNWQKFCSSNGDESVLPFLLRISFLLDDGVSPIVLQLLQNAICPMPPLPAIAHHPPSGSKGSRSAKAQSPTKGMSRSGGRGEKSKSEEPGLGGIGEPIDHHHHTSSQQLRDQNEMFCASLVHQINCQSCLSDGTISKFIEKFLLDCNSTAVRWQAHALVVSIQKNSSLKQQRQLVDILWKLWHRLPYYGRKAAQFVDLLGYFSLKTNLQDGGSKMKTYIEEAVGVLRSQNANLANHPNASIYSNLAQLVQLNGYYLESDPCLVCNNPEVPYSSLKLSSLKVDTKFTTTTQIVKLAFSHSISKISLRIGDLKRQKMVRTINIYYNNRSVQAVVELKNKPTMWHKAKKVSQEFPLKHSNGALLSEVIFVICKTLLFVFFYMPGGLNCRPDRHQNRISPSDNSLQFDDRIRRLFRKRSGQFGNPPVPKMFGFGPSQPWSLQQLW